MKQLRLIKPKTKKIISVAIGSMMIGTIFGISSATPTDNKIKSFDDTDQIDSLSFTAYNIQENSINTIDNDLNSIIDKNSKLLEQMKLNLETNKKINYSTLGC